MIRWEELAVFWNDGLRFAFFSAKCGGKQESSPTFILSNKERKKAQKNSFFEIFLSKGGRLWKGKVLAPFPSVFFYGLLDTCSFLRIAFCAYAFEKCLLYDNSCISPQEC